MDNERDELFHLQSAEKTKIRFSNDLSPTENFNMYLFRNFYNGGGVAIGDVSGDGLPDLFFTGNMMTNRLYINQGNFVFNDVTNNAGLNTDGYWSTGASMADVNGDGRLDIYVTLSGKPEGEKRYNRLYINNGDSSDINDGSGLTFTESALKYNLEDDGLSTHGIFFDYNKDGRLDLYLVSNSFHEVTGLENATGDDRLIPDPKGASKLYRNDGDSFTDVTQQARIYSSIIEFGMSVSVSDLNRDGWPDLYVTNDFFERDYLYINNGDGTFTESLEDRIRSMSSSSMGSDIADINNDGWPEIYVTDMLPADEERLKSKMTIESWEEYRDKVSRGFHHKFTRNTLQLNRGEGTFSEIGRYSGVYATDWSWAPLIADFDNDGLSDIFVSNGIYKDLLDQDYINRVSQRGFMQRLIQSDEQNVILSLMERMSSQPMSNAVFRNEGDLKFSQQSVLWGLDKPGFSTGAAWADLDNDGDLDLVTNEVNGEARIYKNRSEEVYPDRKWLKVKLKGDGQNSYGIGAKLHVWSGEDYWYREHYLQRGFQSSMEPGLYVGVGEISKIDSLILRWPDGRISERTDVNVPAEITLSQADATEKVMSEPQMASLPGDLKSQSRISSNLSDSLPLLEEAQINVISQWKHQSFNNNLFDRESLLMHTLSTDGPALCTGDVNGDDRDDIYIGGAREQPGALWIQTASGEFRPSQTELFQNDAISDDTDCAFFDATGNGMDDLFVVSGGNSFSSGSSALSDRFYLNDGEGELQKTNQILPTTRAFEPGSVVAPHDFNDDGNMDLFVGIRLRPFAVGLPVNGYLIAGDGQGTFTDVTEKWSPSLLELGMITDAVWTDLTGDGEDELVVTGDWMPVQVFEKKGNQYVDITEQLGLSDWTGWWNALAAGDLNGDGRIDLVATNHGLNSMFSASTDYPVKMIVGDISQNGMIDQVLATAKNGNYYPVALRHDIIEVIPSLNEKYPTYASYAGQTVEEVFTPEQLQKARILEASHMESVVFWNQPDGMLPEKLPFRAQIAPLYGVELLDVTGDQTPEIILGGNLYDVQPLVGPYDASRGVVISFYNGKLQSLPDMISGLNISGEVRAVETLTIGSDNYLFVARQGDSPAIFRVKR